MEMKMSKSDFLTKFKRTGESRTAIFGGRAALMEEIYATGNPIWCDQSYYIHCQELDRVVKVDNHFECDSYTNFAQWRDCHYYSEFVDEAGNKAWLMTGGRYD